MKKTAGKNRRMGICGICNKEVAKSQIARHLKTCLPALAAETDKSVAWFHLAVECPYLPAYWLHVAIPGAKTLRDLDRFLRDVWLECCGHLSGFAINDVRYECQPADEKLFGGPPDQSMSAKIDKVLEPGMEFSHEYDYGSTTDLVLTVAGVFQAPLVRGDSVRLLARNLPPEFRCAGCGKPATLLADGGNGLDPKNCYCKDCSEELDEEEQDMLMPIVNSPRVGVCGYCG